MKIEIDITKNAQENANLYYEKAKKLRKKAEGIRNSIKKLEEKINEINKEASKIEVKKIRKKEWYEKFNWFFTSNNMLAIGGRNANENEIINKKYFLENDLAFHANVFGASLVILKNGLNADYSIKEEVAQFAACYSKAWEDKQYAIDVYALKREQVSKSTQEGYLAKGSFLLKGEREWFRNLKLELYIGLDKEHDRIKIVPSLTYNKINDKDMIHIVPGKTEKSQFAKLIANRLGFDDIDYIIQHLPPGYFSIV